MCNLYSITTNQTAIIALFPVVNRYVGNFPPMPRVFPDNPSPVIRNSEADREMGTLLLARGYTFEMQICILKPRSWPTAEFPQFPTSRQLALSPCAGIAGRP